MATLTFAKGIFPPHKKSASAAHPVEDAALPKEVIIPLSQHAGAPAEPLVETGDRVLAGQKIGEVEARITAPVHASVSGVVSAIEKRGCSIPSGRRAPCVVIEADDEQAQAPLAGVSDVTSESIAKAVGEAGIVGLGGAGFPSSVKLSPPPDRPIDTAVINGCECESYLTADHRVMLEDPEAVIDGAMLVMQATGAKRCLLGIEDNKPDAIETMRSRAAGRLEVVPLKTKYPQGAERMLIKSLTGRAYPTGKLPADVGVVIQNVQTCAAIHYAVREGRPLIERIMTVTGAVKEPKNLKAKVGTPVRSLIEQCGGFSKEPGKVILGGPLTGVAIADLDVPVVKGTSGIVVLGRDEIDLSPESGYGPCIRCSRCVRICPVYILPYQLGILAKNKMYDEAADTYHLFTCIECGSCAYVCPSKIPLLQLIRLSKSNAMLAGKTPGR